MGGDNDWSGEARAPDWSSPLSRRWVVRALVLFAVTFVTAMTLWSAGSPDVLRRLLGRLTSSNVSHEPAIPDISVAESPSRRVVVADGDPRALRLVAAEPGRNASEGRARLGLGRGPTQTYVTGALLANGARLVEVHSDHVVLERDGRSQRLSLVGSIAQEEGVGGFPSAADDGSSDSPDSSSSELRPSREPISQVIRATPVYEGRQLEGYRVFPGVESSLFDALGLRSGDVITSLNGERLDDSARAAVLLREFVRGESASVVVKRGRQLASLTLDGAVIRELRAGHDGQDMVRTIE
jgi:hypothetical protein